MTNNSSKRQLFIDKQEVAQPVTLTKLNPSPSGVAFFNVNMGSQLQDAPTLDYIYKEKEIAKLSDLQTLAPGGVHTIVVTPKWFDSSPRLVDIPSGNTTVKKRVRDAIVADQTSHMKLSVWQDLIPQIEEQNVYKITDVSVREFFVTKLAITSTTIIIPEPKLTPFSDWSKIDFTKFGYGAPSQKEIICQPDILSVKVSTYPMCTGKRCMKKLTPFPGETLVRCLACTRTMLLEKTFCGLNCEIEIYKEPKPLTLTVFPETLDKFLGVNVISEYKDNLTMLEERILRLVKVDLYYNVKKNILTEITICTHNGDQQQ